MKFDVNVFLLFLTSATAYEPCYNNNDCTSQCRSIGSCICNERICVEVECTKNEHCSMRYGDKNGFICNESHHCQMVQCTNNLHCRVFCQDEICICAENKCREVECTRNHHCVERYGEEEGYICNKSHQCERVECTKNHHCIGCRYESLPFACDKKSNRCVEVDCVRNEHCREKERCIYKKCKVMFECEKHSHCKDDEICRGNRCYKRECYSNFLCGDNEICKNHKCIPGKSKKPGSSYSYY
ncbi:Oidioi.mRNA.OKI2018_I69.chr2.g8272.t1.cds [Oikopleura dioica]|uniref:Oidioi.mRNA.OKI2018_I69.chr2.g8272.t1.cds n=1 Tax=Oikopleura dioica TaxID=34765 RepID=A0ABN7TEY8_OIKDI|nr:Oidioi.mRNA.OKI2018_I69.chr2.g8272.t1.cds [Oikopleura dioica]